MRNSTEMMETILGFARNDSRVRCVIMNGSRANPEAPKDIFQDYDIVYVVKAYDTFISDPDWIDVFGRRIMLQMPETMRDPMNDGRFAYLMLFEDGNRIDLTLVPYETQSRMVERDSQSLLLLDKDGVIQPFASASDNDYHIKRPTKLEYESCCNNFWWCLQNVAKGIWRDELSYAMLMYHCVVRQELHDMLEWAIGIRHDFQISAGKWGKYYKNLLESDQYERYAQTYSDSQSANMWEALTVSCGLFRETAVAVSKALRLTYPSEDDRKMTAYLEWVRGLKASARSADMLEKKYL